MLPAFTSFRTARRSPGRFSVGVTLCALFVLGSAFPQFQSLLPRDPVAYAAVPSRAHSQPVMWFPLAYTLSGLPETGWTPGLGPHLQDEVPAGEDASVAPMRWTDPALPVAVLLWWALFAPPTWLRALRGRRPRAPDLSALDPPPRLRPAWL